ncbi:hypothetical protein FB45DRAFT_1043647 [Roridomyces roridus]|uniref:Uncharacterized protein n=1 Tax=Roridomyces roridus TaxID=1738132 RepID=A0AAD7AYX3_9AGAR|nr:hypothetical protein FB45DRAFT_1043647 [Roridomyces roridus]
MSSGREAPPSSSVLLTGHAWLRDPQRVGNSHSYFLDGTMFTNQEDGNGPIISGRFKFFNANRLELPPIGFYGVAMNICETNPAYNLGPNADSHEEYTIVGDIQQLVPLHEVVNPPAPSDDASQDGATPAADSEASVPEVRLPKFDTAVRPYMIVCGLTSSKDNAASTFTMDLRQYTQVAGGYGALRVSCHIPDSGRWAAGKKPIPFEGRYSQVSGHLCGVDESGALKITVDNVVFLGNARRLRVKGPPKLLLNSLKRKATINVDGTPDWVSGSRKKGKGKLVDTVSSSPASGSQGR